MFANATFGANFRDAVSSFADTAESMTDLRVLRAIDDTIEAMVAECRFYRGHAGIGRALIDAVSKAPVIAGNCVDPEGQLNDVLAKLVSHNESNVERMRRKKSEIDVDGRLRTHHCDQLHASYDDAIAALNDDTEVVRDLAAALVSHDLAAETREGRCYESVAKLHKAIVGE